MRKLFLLGALAALLCGCSSAPSPLRLMSFNIEHTDGSFEADSTTSWDARHLPVLAMLRDVSPDVAFFQESQKRHLDDLETDLASDYALVRYDQKGGGYYFMAFIYKKSRIELVSSEPRWFSPDPKVPFTSGEWNPKYTKMAVVGRFKDLESGKEFVMIGSHFFPNGEIKIKCSELMRDWVGEFAGESGAAVACGDMNLRPGDESLQPLYDIMQDAVDAAPVSDGREAWTFQRWGVGKPCTLDHLFFRGLEPLEYHVVSDGTPYGLKYLSDHNAIYCDFVL